MKVKVVIHLLILLAFFCGSEAYSQYRSTSKPRISSRFVINKKYTSVGISLNAINYFGDLAPKDDIFSTNLSLTRPDLGLVVTRRMGPRLTVKGTFNWGRIKGDDFTSADPNDELGRYRYVRNLSFRNSIKELAVVGEIDFFENQSTFRSRRSVTPYIFAGIAVFHHNPQTQVPSVDVNNSNAPFANAGDWVKLKPLKTEGEDYKNIQLAIPFGLGVRFKLEERWDLAFEIGYRHLFFDYIDDVSQDFVDLGSLSSDLARALSDRSRETVAVESGETRQIGVIPNGMESYTSSFDGNTYTTIAGYGRDAKDNIRGDKGDADIYIITGFQLTYILSSGRYRNAKFR